MRNKKILKIIYASLFAALTCVVTMFPQIPVAATSGYIHMGDAVLLTGAWVLGPVYGALAAGVGSTLADVFSGYVLYAPVTFVVKFITALLAALLANILKRHIKAPSVCYTLSAAVGEVFMVLGYFIYELCLYGIGAVASIPPNCIQGAFGVIAGVIIISLLTANKAVRKFILNEV